MLESSANAVSAVVIALLGMASNPDEVRVQSERMPLVWTSSKLENPRDTPIELRVSAEDPHPFVSGWKNTATALPAQGEQVKYEAGFALNGTYGRIRVTEATAPGLWSPVSASTTIKDWTWVRDREPVVSTGGRLDHGVVAFDYVRFKLTNAGVAEDCFGYVGAQDRWQIDGYACGRAGQFVAEAAIADFIRAIGFPQILNAKPITLSSSRQ